VRSTGREEFINGETLNGLAKRRAFDNDAQPPT
jgi:hypothetical protein